MSFIETIMEKEKRMQKKLVVIVFFMVLISVLVVGCGSNSQPVDLTVGKELVESRCTTCHGIEQIQNKQFSRQEWTDTVDRMINDHGAAINEQQKSDIIDYLAATYK